MKRLVAPIVAAVVWAVAASPSSAQTPEFLTDTVTVTLDGVAVGQPMTPLGSSLRYTVAYHAPTARYHIWAVSTDTGPLTLGQVVHGTSRNGIAFTSDGLLGYLGGNPFPGLFASTVEPEVNFLNALAVGNEWKLLVWTPNGTGYGEYNYNTSVNSFGTTPDNRLLLQQGRIGAPGGVGIGGLHVGVFGIVNGKLYVRVDDLVGGLGRFTYTDGFLPAGPTSSSWGTHTTADLFAGTPWVWGLANPGAPNAAYVHNQGRTFAQPDGSLATYYGFRLWSGGRAEKQLWFTRSTDDGSTWSVPAPVFSDPASVTIDGAPIPADGYFSTVDAAIVGGGQRLYFSARNGAGQVVLVTTATFRLAPVSLAVDVLGNGVLETGEAALMQPRWENVGTTAVSVGGVIDDLAGPGTSTYTILDEAGFYGSAAGGATVTCAVTGDCYGVHVSEPAVRPAVHWDATVDESLSSGDSKTWVLHLGESFTDVPRTSPFYRFVETLLHHGVTGGCTSTAYCPQATATREQMAVFVLVAKEGASYVPPACGAVPQFPDVPPSSPFCRWVEELARRGVVGGCGGGNYCPGDNVLRDQMAVFVLRTVEPTLNPPACGVTPMFPDVPPSSAFCRWVEELARRGIVSGCGGGNYCPLAPVTREQMGVFVSVTFRLVLYGV